MTSIRRRVLLGAVGTVVVALGVSAYAIHAWFAAALLAGADAGLRDQARALAALVEVKDHDGRQRFDLEVPPTWVNVRYRICRSDGTMIVESPDAHSTLPLMVVDQPPIISDDDWRVGTWRFPALVEDQEQGQPPVLVTVTVAAPLTMQTQALRQLVWIQFSATIACALIAALVLALVLMRALRPLTVLADQLTALDAASLDQRVALPAQRELQPVAARLNDLLARLQAAFMREKAYNAAIAHELRTPIAGLLATTEVCTMQERDAAAYRTAVETCQRIGIQVRGLVDRLLLLAKLDAGLLPVRLRPLALSAFLHDCWAVHAVEAEARALQVSWDEQGPDRVCSDADALRMVVTNLCDNVVSHADQGSVVHVATRGVAGGIELTIRNRSQALTPTSAAHVFERFWRGDVARQDSGRHCGLGLSLCRDLLAALGGRIEARSADGWFSVSVWLPIEDPACRP